MSDSANEYVTEPVRLRGTGRAFHIKSGGSHFHLCHTFIFSCQEFPFFLLLPIVLSLTLSKQHLWHLLDFICIAFYSLSWEKQRIRVGREMSDLVTSLLWFIIVQSAKKKFHYSSFFFFSPHGFCNGDVLPHYLPPLIWGTGTSNHMEFCFQVLFLVVDVGDNVLYHQCYF